VPKKTSGIPRSLANSRETSPSRGATTHFGTLRRNIYSSSPKRPERPPINPGRPVMAQKILQQSREAEYALADALVRYFIYFSGPFLGYKNFPKFFSHPKMRIFLQTFLG
jgi:hypothetical protein